jgi:hypothetical protein
MKKIVFGGLILVMILASIAEAQVMDGKAAKKALFAPLKAEVEILAAAGLPADQAAALQAVGEAQPYYGAIAISPGEGLMAEATVAAANYHDTDAAAAVALAECNAKKKAAEPCVVAALIRPKGWDARGFQMSSDATAGFKADYKAKGGALAISKATGAWGLSLGAEAAVAACVARNEAAKDCEVVIEN